MSAINTKRLKLAETTSSIGAGVLGIGLGAYFNKYIDEGALLITAIGFIMHAWGMADKRLLEKRDGIAVPWWSNALYWFCWIMLFCLAVYLLVRAQS